MIELAKDSKSGTWIITTTDREGFHRQLNVSRNDMLDLFELLGNILSDEAKEY